MDWNTLISSLEPSGDPAPGPASTPMCRACHTEPAARRGRCAACYARWAGERPVGIGASCAGCGERRLDTLRTVELGNTFATMCGNCALRMARLPDPPTSLLALRLALWRSPRTHGASGEIRVDDHPELVIELNGDLDEWAVRLPAGVDDPDETLIRG